MKTILKIFFLLTLFALASCFSEEFVSVEESVQHAAILHFEGSINRYDDVKTRATTSVWPDGARIYIQYQTANGVASGSAVYSSSSDTWTVTYSGTLTQGKAMSCSVYYFEDPSSMTATYAILNAHSASYADAEASYFFEDGTITIQGILKPLLGRIRFKGTAGTSFTLSGLKWFSGYGLSSNGYSQQDGSLTLTTGSDGFTPYVYVEFSDASVRMLTLTSRGEVFTKTFSSNVLDKGRSGFLNIPTMSSHQGWTVKGTDLQGTLVIGTYPGGKADFDLCNAADGLRTNWSQFSVFVLTDALENMKKEDFDAQYVIDGTPTHRALADGGEIWEAKVYGDVKGAAAPIAGTVEYYFNSQSQTNHAWKWSFTEDELEALTHDTTTPVTITRYIRFIGSAAAKYPYIYVKLETVISRATVANVMTSKKRTNYWFAQDGNDDGLDAIIFNVNHPLDDKDTKVFNRAILSTYEGNALTVAPAVASKKFFFAPKNTNIKTSNGTAYLITPKRSATDEKWNAFVCLYGLHQPDKYTTHKWGTDAQNKSILEKCAINYEDGLFTNNALYAMSNNVYIQIATLNQYTGEVNLIQNDAARDVLNAIGYVENHANIMTEFHTFVGITAKQNCAAVNVENGSFANFVVSWQRPINLRDNGKQQAVDAMTNGNYIYAYDFLRFFDFRGPVEGDMEGNNKWLWAYYNIKSITLDCTPSKIMTNMHQTTPTKFVPMNNITTQAEVGCFKDGNLQRSKVTYNFDISSYNNHSKNQALLDYMKANKDLFGVIYFANNGDNVTEFDIKVPIEVTYEWGTFCSTVTVHIVRT